MHRFQNNSRDKLPRGSGSLNIMCACLAGFAFSANYTNHAPLIPSLMAEFGFGMAMAGFLTTAIFLSHAAMQIPGGYIADRFGSRHIIAIALAQVGIGNMAIAFAASYWQLIFWKTFIGLGTGTCFVAGARYIAASCSSAQAYLAQGCYGGSILLGSGFVIFAVPRFAEAFGWRSGFLATAVIAAISFILWIAAAPAPAEKKQALVSFRGMMADHRLWQPGLVQMASFGLVMVVSSWITTFLQRNLLFDPLTAGQLGSTALLLGILMRPLGGLLLSRMPVRILLELSILLSTSGCFALALTRNSTPLAGLGIVLLGAGCGLPYSALFTRAAELFPSRAGAAMGLVNMLGILMILAAPPLIGALAEWSRSFQSSFLALGVFSLAVFACVVKLDKSAR